MDDRTGVSRARAPAGEPAPAGRTAVARHVRNYHSRSGDAADLPHDREDRSLLGNRVDPGRIGNGEGADGEGVARAVDPPRRTVCRYQLCGDTGDSPRKRTVRLRKGSVYGRGQADTRQDRDRKRRDAFSRRNWGSADVTASEAAAFLAGARDRARSEEHTSELQSPDH